MQAATLYSAFNEEYSEHITACRKKFEILYPVFRMTTVRIFDGVSEAEIETGFRQMVLLHDLGKLTAKWQEMLKMKKGQRLPPHASIGAAAVWISLQSNPLREPLSFAVAIHHTDRGLIGDNIERPEVLAIIDGLVNETGEVKWHQDIVQFPDEFFPNIVRRLDIGTLKDMAQGLRIWARGGGLLVQHRCRLQVALAHHILKLCDISAAQTRSDYQQAVSMEGYGGWLMVKNISDYVDAIEKRLRR
uniref:CRISPR-associated endonuclease Cas3 n=1 Tax=candidate division WOR-3 bacterium TaxID=2052148 RepID=A0A7C1SCX7_UNCW3